MQVALLAAATPTLRALVQTAAAPGADKSGTPSAGQGDPVATFADVLTEAYQASSDKELTASANTNDQKFGDTAQAAKGVEAQVVASEISLQEESPEEAPREGSPELSGWLAGLLQSQVPVKMVALPGTDLEKMVKPDLGSEAAREGTPPKPAGSLTFLAQSLPGKPAVQSQLAHQDTPPFDDTPRVISEQAVGRKRSAADKADSSSGALLKRQPLQAINSSEEEKTQITQTRPGESRSDHTGGSATEVKATYKKDPAVEAGVLTTHPDASLQQLPAYAGTVLSAKGPSTDSHVQVSVRTSAATRQANAGREVRPVTVASNLKELEERSVGVGQTLEQPSKPSEANGTAALKPITAETAAQTLPESPPSATSQDTATASAQAMAATTGAFTEEADHATAAGRLTSLTTLPAVSTRQLSAHGGAQASLHGKAAESTANPSVGSTVAARHAHRDGELRPATVASDLKERKERSVGVAQAAEQPNKPLEPNGAAVLKPATLETPAQASPQPAPRATFQDTAIASAMALAAAGPGVAAKEALNSAASPQPTRLDTFVQPEVQSPGFAPAFSARIATLARDGLEQARVHLNPVEMGPVSVHLSMEGSLVRVDMTADVAATRQVLEQALPTLAGALREAGFTLNGGGVHQPPAEPRSQTPQDTNTPANPQGSSSGGTFSASSNGTGAQGDPSAAFRQDDPRQDRAARSQVITLGLDSADPLTQGAGSTAQQPGVRLVDVFA